MWDLWHIAKLILTRSNLSSKYDHLCLQKTKMMPQQMGDVLVTVGADLFK